MNGFLVGVIGLGLCMILCGLGSAIGLYKACSAAAGVIGEDAKKYSKVFLLALLPATQGLYGFVISIIGSGKLATGMAMEQGFALFGAVLPMIAMGLISAIFQGKTAVNSIYAVAKEDSVSGKMILFPAMIETYAILSFVISIMLMGTV